MNQPRLSWALACLALLAAASAASATTYVRMSDEALFDRSPLVVEGLVLEVRSAPTAVPHTDYGVRVLEVFKGEAQPGERLVVRVLGGVGDGGLALRVWGAPSFARGDRVLLFLRPNSDGTAGIEQLIFGGFRRVVHNGKAIAWRNLGEASELGTAEQRQEPLRDYRRFRSWIRAKASEENAAAITYRLQAALFEGAEFSLMRTTPNDPQQCNEPVATPIRWFVFPSSVAIAAHQGGQPGLAGGGFSEIQTALAAWTGDPDSNISYVYGGTTASTAQCNNSIVFADPDNAIPGSFGGSGTVAIGGPCFSCAVQLHNAVSFHPTSSAFVITQDGIDSIFSGPAGSTKAEELFAHELGHTLGLGHTGVANSLMNPALHNPPIGASFSSDDLAGIQALYGTAAPPSPPAAPSGLGAAATSSTQVNLTWIDNSNNETEFRVEIDSTNNGADDFTDIGSRPANSTTAGIPGLTPSTSYRFRVRARNGSLNSAYSNIAFATTLAGATPPAAPTNLAANALSPTSIQLAWSDNATNETNYLAEIDATVNGLDDFQQLSPLLAANSTGATISNLLPATPYRFRVKALSGDGDSPYSNVAQASTQPATGPAPAAPASLAALALSPTAIQLTWADASDNEDSFRVEREVFGSFVEVASTPAGQSSFNDSGLSPSTLYTYRVRARNANGDSVYSNTASATTLGGGGGPTTPAAPEGLAAVALPNGHVVLTWADRSSDEDSFVLEHEEAAGFKAFLTLAANLQFADVAGLAAGRVHRFRLKAHNAAGDSPYSNVAAVALPAPAPPAGAWLETPEIRGFRFKTRIDGELQGTQVLDCVPDTLCVAGAIPSRTEVFLRVIGPRPNGKLWAQVVRFTVSRVEVWVEQSAGGEPRYYDLPALPASASVLSGLNDSQAFTPAEGGVRSIDELLWRDATELRHQQAPPAAVRSGEAGVEADPPPPGGDWLTTPELPGFRFQARIGEGSAQRPATPVLDCVPQTLCLAGSLPDRTELFVRIIGPRPNGFLWAQLVRFTVSPVEIWIEQTATRQVRHYRLDQLPAASPELPGRNDSEAFLP